jgi:Ras GTPase-activating-like protein IQGAP2/3
MHSNYAYRTRSALGHPATSPSPLRHASTASSNSSGYSYSSQHYAPSQSSNASSNAPEAQGNGYAACHRRGLSEATTIRHPPRQEEENDRVANAASTYQSIRQSLRPASRTAIRYSEPTPVSTPVSTPPAKKSPASHGRSYSVDDARVKEDTGGAASPTMKLRPQSTVMSRSDSVRGHDKSSRTNGQHVHFNQQRLEKPELQDFQRSSTGHLKTLSKFEDQDLALVSRDTEVVGMHGRRRLKRGNSIRANRTGTG